MKYIHQIILPALALALLGGCKTANTPTNTAVAANGLSKPLTTDNVKVYDPKIETADFSNITVAFNVNGSALSSRASMRIIKDSIIQISVQPVLGIEVARLSMTPKGFVLMDKINKKYYESDYDSLLAKVNLKASFSDLQALLLNKLFIVGEPSAPAEQLIPKLKLSTYFDGIMLRSKSSSTGISTEFMLDHDAQLKLTTISLPSLMLRCFYSSFTQQKELVFPFKYRLMLIDGPAINEAEITINSVEFNKKIKINTSDLSDYTRVDKLEQIIPN